MLASNMVPINAVWLEKIVNLFINSSSNLHFPLQFYFSISLNGIQFHQFCHQKLCGILQLFLTNSPALGNDRFKSRNLKIQDQFSQRNQARICHSKQEELVQIWHHLPSKPINFQADLRYRLGRPLHLCRLPHLHKPPLLAQWILHHHQLGSVLNAR